MAVAETAHSPHGGARAPTNTLPAPGARVCADSGPKAVRRAERAAQMRRAPTYVCAYQPVIDETFTTSPVCGAWMNWFWPM
jgi:hypothetical protein